MEATQKNLRIALLISVGVVLNLLEPPFFVILPGAKLGLAQLATVVALFIYGPLSAFIVTLIRSLITSLIRGGIFSLSGLLTIGGSFGGFLIMSFLKSIFKEKMSIIAISSFGGMFNNLTQFLIVYFITQNIALLYYFPFIIVLGGLAGFLIGTLAKIIIEKIKFL